MALPQMMRMGFGAPDLRMASGRSCACWLARKEARRLTSSGEMFEACIVRRLIIFGMTKDERPVKHFLIGEGWGKRME